MEQYIKKSALVAEIERRVAFFMKESKKKTTSDDSSCAVALYGLLFFIDSLEVKKVDLDAEIKSWLKSRDISDGYYEEYTEADIWETAKHFYDLGLKVQKGE